MPLIHDLGDDGAIALPTRLPSPFASAPHPIAMRAARDLIGTLPAAPREGKMYGVLVVRAASGALGAIRAFSGMLDGDHRIAGFCEPVFDLAARDAFWIDGEAELGRMDRAIERAQRDGAPAIAARAALAASHATAIAGLRADHATNKKSRDALRGTRAKEELDAWSRADGNARRAMERRQADEMAAVARAAAEAARTVDELVTTKREMSRGFLARIHATYRFANWRGETRSLADIFAPHAPPGGAGDCAAPKLFAHALRHQLQPIALAEFWWGPPPPTGDRHSGIFYPACRGKCGPILAHVLAGLDADRLPAFASTAPADEPRTIFEDAHVVVVDKPIGLLSVPGRTGQHRDSVETRLRARYPSADLHVVHRLDLDTSGLLLVAKDLATYKELQRLFATRAITKHYVARLERGIEGIGAIELPLRGDIDDRPRQIVDRAHGKHAVTRYESLGGDRIAFFPITGRTHQLRVHAAHPDGLGNPIRGDRLYGTVPEDRLYLHAETLEFAGRTFVSPAPF